MPKMIEVDETEYQQMTALRGIASKIVAKPEARKLLEQAHKIVDPNALTPTLDAEKRQVEPVNALKSELTAEIEKLRKEREDEKREATLARIAADQERGFHRLKTQHHYTDEGVEAIRKLMETKGLIDVDDAVAIFERTNPPPVPATPGGGIGGAWNFTDMTGEADKSIADMLASKGQNDQIVDRLAHNTLMELRGQARR